MFALKNFVVYFKCLILDYLEWSSVHSAPDIRIAGNIQNGDATCTNLKDNTTETATSKMADNWFDKALNQLFCLLMSCRRKRVLCGTGRISLALAFVSTLSFSNNFSTQSTVNGKIYS